jgi:predicted acylesterase/phospholipase RssA
MKAARTVSCAVLALAAASCSARRAVRAPEARRTCLVLSVAGPKGAAMAGAVEALQAKGYRFDCVYGNSMGAIVGALLASHPGASISGRYRNFVEAARADGTGDLLARAGGVVRRFLGHVMGVHDGYERIDPALFERTLADWTDGATFESLPVPFATSYALVMQDRIEIVVARQGRVANAVTRSAANPRLFELGHSSTLTAVDPGVDRKARVPAEDACDTFGPADLVVVNASGSPLSGAPARCGVVEVVVDVGPADLTDLSVDPADLDRLHQLGWASAQSAPVPSR